MANFSAQPYETIKADIESLEAEISNTFDTISPKRSGYFDGREWNARLEAEAETYVKTTK